MSSASTRPARSATAGGPVSRRHFVRGGAAVALTAASWRRVWGANERIGVGLIGYGLVGERHAVDLLEQPDTEIVGVAEAHRGRRAEAVERMGGRTRPYDDFRRLLDAPEVDAVCIATPDHWHALMTMLACAAGKDVYVEKPLTLFVREGAWMKQVAERHKRVVQVGTQQRSGPHYQRARQLLRDGHIGQIVGARVEFYRNLMPGLGSPPDTAPPPELDWDMFTGPAPLHPYNRNRGIYLFRWFWDYSGGQMTNIGQHALDIVDWVLPEPGPRRVSCAGGRWFLRDNCQVPDTQEAVLEYPNWTLTISLRECCGGSRAVPLQFFGTKGALRISRQGFQVQSDRRIPPLAMMPRYEGGHPVGGLEEVEVPRSAPLRTTELDDQSGDARKQFKDHIRNFLDCVRTRETPRSDLASGHRVVTALHLANLALRLGRPLQWDAQREEIVGDSEANGWLERPYRPPWDQVLQAVRA